MKEVDDSNIEKQALDIPVVSVSYCEWKRYDFGMIELS